MNNLNRNILKAWVRAIVEQSWKLPFEEVRPFLDAQFALLERDFPVKIRWDEIRMVQIEELEELEEQDEEPTDPLHKPRLRIVE